MERRIWIKTLAFGLALSTVLLGCLPAFAAEFDVYEDNGYNQIVVDYGFEGMALGTTVPSGPNNLGLFDYRGTGSTQLEAPSVKAAPVEESNGVKRNHVTYLELPQNSVSNNYIQVRPPAINPYGHNDKVNPSEAYRKKFLQAKLELDALFTSTDLEGFIYFYDYDGENTQGHGAFPQVPLVSFANGKMTLRNAPEDTPEILFETNTWYHFTVYTDFVSGTYTLYRNQELLGEDLPFFTDGKTGVMAAAYGVNLSKKTLEGSQGVYLDNFKYSTTSQYSRQLTVAKSFVDSETGSFDTIRPASATFPSKHGFQWVDASEAEHGKVVRLYHRNNDGSAMSDNFFAINDSLVQGTDTSKQLEGEDLAKAGKAVFTFDLNLSAYDELWVTYRAFTTSNKIETYTLLDFTNQGYIKVKSRDSGNRACDAKRIAYEPNKWYSFRVYMDFTDHTYSMCVNGQNVMENAPMPEVNSKYAVTPRVHWMVEGSGGVDKDAYVDIDNFTLSFVNCEAAPRLIKTEQSADSYKLACLPGQDADMILAGYESGQALLRDVQISTGAADTYHLISCKEEPNRTYRLFWWQLNQGMKPLTGLPTLDSLAE